ncbi:hypothetical protein DSO57_1021568 [Entomophthora muscae]|uniref:Uncharacterized protein n=1 Tax=Entomophthora muscae TaxID=34485 RepID=A0ACC2U1K0_9FUNG|nr:hypothetical protein DSO57_1021568 [Entomophthora muscae]
MINKDMAPQHLWPSNSKDVSFPTIQMPLTAPFHEHGVHHSPENQKKSPTQISTPSSEPVYTPTYPLPMRKITPYTTQPVGLPIHI